MKTRNRNYDSNKINKVSNDNKIIKVNKSDNVITNNDLVLAGLLGAMNNSVKKITENLIKNITDNPENDSVENIFNNMFDKKEDTNNEECESCQDDEDEEEDYDDEECESCQDDEKFKCPSFLCNHIKNKNFKMDKEIELSTLSGLIELGQLYHCKNFTRYKNINLYDLNKILPYLVELNNMVGMAKVKKSIVNQLNYFIKGFNKTILKCGVCYGCSNNKNCEKKARNPLHIAFFGPPGTGKTQLGRIIGNIYSKMGLLSKGSYKMINAIDTASGTIGGTSINLNKIIKQCSGGVLFIDEIYSIGSGSDHHNISSAKEFVDTLVPALSNKEDFACFIGGYREAVEKNIYSLNQGLKGRIMFTYDLDPYNPSELFSIFELMVKYEGLELFTPETYENNKNELISLIKHNKNYFINNGRDVESLLHYTKLVLCNDINPIFNTDTKKYGLSIDNIKESLVEFKDDRKVKIDEPPLHMYI